MDVAEETLRTEEDTLHTEEDEQMVEDNEVFAEDVEHMVDDDDVVLEDVSPISEALSLEHAISCQIIELQKMWDEAHIPTGLQGQMLERLFGSLEKQPNLHSSGKLDHTRLSLEKLLTLVGPDWKGELGEYDVPCSWSSLKKMYSYLGLVEAQRWRLCNGSKEARSPPELLNLSLEDVYEGPGILPCVCLPRGRSKFKRDCVFCSEKCPTCKMKRKNILAFEQLPLGKLLGVLVSTKTVCFKFYRVGETWFIGWEGMFLLSLKKLKKILMVVSSVKSKIFLILKQSRRLLLFVKILNVGMRTEFFPLRANLNLA